MNREFIAQMRQDWTLSRPTRPLSPEGLVPQKNGIICANRSRLTTLPLSIFVSWPNIKLIYLEGNFLATLPLTFFDDLPKLAYLDLRNNKLEELPGMKFIHKNLRICLLQNNILKTLPPTICFARRLRGLGLTGNPLEGIPEETRNRGTIGILAYLFSLLKPEELIRKHRVLASASETQLNLRVKAEEAEFDGYGGLGPPGSAPAAGNKYPIELREKVKDIDEIFKKRVQRAWRAFGSIPVTGNIILDQSAAYIRERVSNRLKIKAEEALQRMKDKEALKKWRLDTNRLVYHGPNKEYLALQAPFANEHNSRFYRPEESEVKYLSPKDFDKELTIHIDKLKKINSIPPTDDFNEALDRLKQIEDIQKDLINLKFKFDKK